MTNVKDVLGGQRTLLQIQDLYTVQSHYDSNSGLLETLNFFQTADSAVSGQVPGLQQGTGTANMSPGPGSFPTQAGWMYNLPQQTLVVFSADHSYLAWNVTVIDSGGGSGTTSSFNPSLPASYSNQGYQQIVMGDFLGTGLDQALLIYADRGVSGELFLRARLAAPIDTNVLRSGLRFGDAYELQTGISPYGTLPVAAGDFAGTGKKELAVLLSDGVTIEYFSVDPSTLNLSLIATTKLPNSVSPAAMAAGRFLTPTNEDLAVVGQIHSQSNQVGTSVTFLDLTPQAAAPGFAISQPVSTFVPAQENNAIINVLAQAAPLQDWSSNIDQLIYTSNKSASAKDSVGHLIIGSFDQSLAYTMQSDSQVTEGDPACIHSFVAGNFDNLDSSGNYDPQLEVAVYWSSGQENCSVSSNGHSLALSIWKVDPTAGADWLGKNPVSKVIDDRVSSDLLGVSMVAGDLQGRSLRLGPPEKVTITGHVQPDIVLGIPPMHVDWIDPLGTIKSQAGCGQAGIACLVNLTAYPTKPAPGKGFGTEFAFSSTAAQNSSRKTTTSWTLGVKTSLALQAAFDVPGLGEALAKVNLAAGYQHDHTVARTYDTYSSTTNTLSASTGFDDVVLYSSRRDNFYYYPVLGKSACPADLPTCSDDQKRPVYVVYSVPDQVQETLSDAAQADWYQPVWEPGNIFSYPWTAQQLTNAFHADLLTDQNAPVDQIGTHSDTYSTSWAKREGMTTSTGTSNSFSQSVGVSVTGGAMIEDLFSNQFTASIKVSGNEMFGSLNESTQTLSSSDGIAVNNPGFAGDVAQCCSYQFSSYALGMQPFAKPFQNLKQNVDLNASGPLFVGFNADISQTPWWQQAYVFPDVGLNHPERWNYSNYAITFNKRGAQGILPEDDPFYHMKGFFITTDLDAGGSPLGPTVSQATEGDVLQLTTRVYNFSPEATPANATIYLSVWCQEYGDGRLTGKGSFVGYTQVGSIPGFEATELQNWKLATVPFNTTGYAGKQLVFWVLVFMVDPEGRLLPEMPGHGLSANPSNIAYTNISDIPAETYSNNVGMFGTGSPLFVVPKIALGASPPPTAGAVRVEGITFPRGKLLLGQREKVSVELTTGEEAASPVSIAYYDGDPASGAQSFSLQSVPYIGPSATYQARAFYKPQTCGEHTIYAVATTAGAQPSEKFVRAKVTIDPTQATEGILSAIENDNLPSSAAARLERVLRRALRHFEQGQTEQGLSVLRDFEEDVKRVLKDDDAAKVLIAQSEGIVGCAGHKGDDDGDSSPEAELAEQGGGK